jgi:hypothetical protein
MDTVPDGRGGKTVTPFIQEISFEAAPLLSYGSQKVHALRYTCMDWATDQKADPATMFPVFEERGYFIWVPEEGNIILQVSNPRGLSMLALGVPDEKDSFKVTTDIADSRYGVLASNYIETVEMPIGYEAALELQGDDQFLYTSNTLLKMPDGSIFNQTDITTLKRY